MIRNALALFSAFAALCAAGAISSCATDFTSDITTPGHYWLESDLAAPDYPGHCITFRTGSVSLDCRGHSITIRGGTPTTGVHAVTFEGPNSTLANCVLREADPRVQPARVGFVYALNQLTVRNSSFYMYAAAPFTGEDYGAYFFAHDGAVLTVEGSSFIQATGNGEPNYQSGAIYAPDYPAADVVSRNNRFVDTSIQLMRGGSLESEGDRFEGSAGIGVVGLANAFQSRLSVRGGSFHSSFESIVGIKTDASITDTDFTFQVSGDVPDDAFVASFSGSSDVEFDGCSFDLVSRDAERRLPSAIYAPGPARIVAGNTTFSDTWVRVHGGSTIVLEAPLDVGVSGPDGLPAEGAEIAVYNNSYDSPYLIAYSGGDGFARGLSVPYLLEAYDGILRRSVDNWLTPHTITASLGGQSASWAGNVTSASTVLVQLGVLQASPSPTPPPEPPQNPSPSPSAEPTPTPTEQPSTPDAPTEPDGQSQLPEDGPGYPSGSPLPTAAEEPAAEGADAYEEFPSAPAGAQSPRSQDAALSQLALGSGATESERSAVLHRLEALGEDPSDERAVLREYERLKAEQNEREAGGAYSRLSRMVAASASGVAQKYLLAFLAAALAIVVACFYIASKVRGVPVGGRVQDQPARKSRG